MVFFRTDTQGFICNKILYITLPKASACARRPSDEPAGAAPGVPPGAAPVVPPGVPQGVPPGASPGAPPGAVNVF